MRIGIDYYKTLTKHPTIITNLVKALQLAGHEVFLISAVNAKEAPQAYRNKIDRDCKAFGVKFDRVVVVTFNRDEQNAEVKLKACQRWDIEMMFDDREDVCQILIDNNIPSFKVIQ